MSAYIEQTGMRNGDAPDAPPLHIYRLRAGSVVHIDGFPVRVTEDTTVETATDLVSAMFSDDAKTGHGPA